MTAPAPTEDYLTASQLAARLQRTPVQLLRAIHRGLIRPDAHAGRQILFKSSRLPEIADKLLMPQLPLDESAPSGRPANARDRAGEAPQGVAGV